MCYVNVRVDRQLVENHSNRWKIAGWHPDAFAR